MRRGRAAGVPGCGLGARARARGPRRLHPDGQRTRGQHTARARGDQGWRRGGSARVRRYGHGRRAGNIRQPGPVYPGPVYPGGTARPVRTSRTLALPAGSWHPAGAGLQGLRLLPRLAARFRAYPGPGVGPGRDRARPADRARVVGRPVGSSSHPGPAGRLGAPRQSRLVRGARSARARPPGRRHRAAGLYALGRYYGRAS